MGSHATPNNQLTIIVNTREKLVPRGNITYEEVVALAFDPGADGGKTC